jgi:signal transduction histidine kinase
MSIPTRLPLKDGAMTAAPSHRADAHMVARTRLLLALSALLAVAVAPGGGAHVAALLLMAGYALACMSPVFFDRWCLPLARGRLMHWLDMVAASVLFAIDVQVDILPVILLVFAIVVASSRSGLREGGCVVIGSVVLYCAGSLAAIPVVAPPQRWLGATVLLALGFAIALLGERKIEATRRLALLRDMNQAANPVFGVDRTITAALENTRAFFDADRCIVLLQESETGCYSCRSVGADGPLTVPAAAIDAFLAQELLPPPRNQILLYRCAWRRSRLLPSSALYRTGESSGWRHGDAEQLGGIAELLEANCFISAPLALGHGKGRIYVTTHRRHLGRADALFLAQIVTQGLRVADRIDLLDRIASDAAWVARKKFAMDLHDSAIQPYIGLKLGLAALRKRAEPANPLIDEIDKLLAVADGVLVQLRDFARGVHAEPGAPVPVCLSALRLQCEQTMAAHGVAISIHTEGRVGFGDRLTAEVLQIVREGLSNICRHTAAKRGSVWLRCSNRLLRIEIDNEGCGAPPPAFQPRSISARAAALGGSACVRQGPLGSTMVCVEIPL